MTTLLKVGVLSGVPNNGTGDVSTIDALMADGGQATLGAQADAANAATDATPASAIALLKQISKSVQGIDAANSNGATVAAAPTVTAGSYSAGYVVGGIMTFANILPPSLNGLLESIAIKFKASVQNTEFALALFSASPGAGSYADHAAPSFAAADNPALIGVFPLVNARSDLGTHTVYNLNGIGQQINGQSQALYGLVVSRSQTANPLASTTDMVVSLGMIW